MDGSIDELYPGSTFKQKIHFQRDDGTLINSSNKLPSAIGVYVQIFATSEIFMAVLETVQALRIQGTQRI